MELKSTIENLSTAFDSFKADYKGKFSEQNSKIRELELMLARSEFPFGGGDMGGVTSGAAKDHFKAFNSFLRSGEDANLRTMEISAALRSDSDPDGGYAVPEQLDKEIVKVEHDLSPMRQIAQVVPVKTSDFKKLISIGGAASGWVSETGARAETTTPTLRQIAPTIGEIYANPAVTQTLLDDAAFDVGAWLGEEIATQFAEQESEAFITGNGVGRPKGILSYTTSADPDSTRDWTLLQHVATGAAATFPDADKLISLVHSLRAGYRKGAVWLMNTATLEYCRKFKDGDSNYIWKAGLEAGAPGMLLGYPVLEDENMPDIGANTYPIAFGNFKRGYLVVDRVGVRVLRDPFSNKPFVHFYTTKRLGGCVQNTQAVKLLKIAVA